MKALPEIPQSWLIGAIMVGLVTLRAFGIDSWTTAALSLVIGYLTGKHIEQKGSESVVKQAEILATARLTAAELVASRKK